VPLDVPPAGRFDVRLSQHYVSALWGRDKNIDCDYTCICPLA